MRVTAYPYGLLLWTGLLFLLFSVFASGNTIDIHLHDTVYIISYKHIFWVTAILLGLFWTIYRLINKLLRWRLLTTIHIIITIGTLVVLFLFSYIFEVFHEAGISGALTGEGRKIINFVLILVSFLLIISQVVFLINLIAGLIKKFT